jgi:hypothetical protein
MTTPIIYMGEWLKMALTSQLNKKDFWVAMASNIGVMLFNNLKHFNSGLIILEPAQLH